MWQDTFDKLIKVVGLPVALVTNLNHYASVLNNIFGALVALVTFLWFCFKIEEAIHKYKIRKRENND